jgi:Tfp pilus assembly protein PilN
MQALRLDFQRTSKPVSIVGLLMLVFALGVVLTLAYGELRLSRRQERLERSVAVNQLTLQRLSRASAPQSPRPRGGEKAIEHANAVWQLLNQPWPWLFQALEDSKTDDVAVLSIEPDAVKKTLRIIAEVKKREAMMAYIQRLQAQPMLRKVELIENHINAQDNEKPLRFSLSAEWGNVS